MAGQGRPVPPGMKWKGTSRSYTKTKYATVKRGSVSSARTWRASWKRCRRNRMSMRVNANRESVSGARIEKNDGGGTKNNIWKRLGRNATKKKGNGGLGKRLGRQHGSVRRKNGPSRQWHNHQQKRNRASSPQHRRQRLRQRFEGDDACGDFYLLSQSLSAFWLWWLSVPYSPSRFWHRRTGHRDNRSLNLLVICRRPLNRRWHWRSHY